MNKKERFVKLVELECLMRAEADKKVRGKTVDIVNSAMVEIDERELPEESMSMNVKMFVGWKLGVKDKPDWVY